MTIFGMSTEFNVGNVPLYSELKKHFGTWSSMLVIVGTKITTIDGSVEHGKYSWANR